jgi:hypothetical protein
MASIQSHQVYCWFMDNSSSLFKVDNNQWFLYPHPPMHQLKRSSRCGHGRLFTDSPTRCSPPPDPIMKVSVEAQYTFRCFYPPTMSCTSPVVSSPPPSSQPAPSFLTSLLAHPFYRSIITTSSLTRDIENSPRL